MQYVVPVEDLTSMLWEPYACSNPSVCRLNTGRRCRFQPFPTRRFGRKFSPLVSKLFEEFSDDEDSDSGDREWCLVIPTSEKRSKIRRSLRTVKELSQKACSDSTDKDGNDTPKQTSRDNVLAENRERIVAISHLEKPEKFSVKLDVKGYKHADIMVKIRDRTVLIDAQRKETNPGTGVYIQRELHRRFSLPKHVNPDAVVSSLDTNGTLTIEAPQSTEEKTSKPQTDLDEMTVNSFDQDSDNSL